jgi:uncharacterized protein (TIGR03435 family)
MGPIFTQLLLAVLSTLATVSQAPAAQEPTFEVASIKQNKTASGNSVTTFLSGGVFTAKDATLKDIIQEAYQIIDDERLQGGPGWMISDRWDIAAKPANATKQEEAVLMLQALLVDRFQLKFHRETQDVNGYALTQARDGAKIRTNTETTCLPPCGGTNVSAGGKLTARKVPMSRFVNRLAQIVGRPVVDSTGLTGEFDMDLDWAPDGGQFGGQGREVPDDSRPSLFTALQEQLGLKLEPRKMSREIFVIDHAEKPSENSSIREADLSRILYL